MNARLKALIESFPRVAEDEFGYGQGRRGNRPEYVRVFAGIAGELHPRSRLSDALNEVNEVIQTWGMRPEFDKAVKNFRETMNEDL